MNPATHRILTLTPAEIAAEASRLDQADQQGLQVRQSTLLHPDMTIDDAYAVQAAWLKLKQERGRELIGHKIGLTSQAMQTAMNITTPDSGFLTDDMVYSPSEHIEIARFVDLKIEVELAFVLGEDLSGTSLTVNDVLDATAYVIPAVEMIAARTHRIDFETGRSRTVIDTIADNAADAGIITGGRAVGPRVQDLRWVGAMLTKNGVVTETGLAGGVLGHPARAIVWLANRYARQGMALRAGQIVLSGSFTRPTDVAPGDHFTADFGALDCFECVFV